MPEATQPARRRPEFVVFHEGQLVYVRDPYVSLPKPLPADRELSHLAEFEYETIAAMRRDQFEQIEAALAKIGGKVIPKSVPTNY